MKQEEIILKCSNEEKELLQKKFPFLRIERRKM